MVGVEPFRLAQQCVDEIVIVETDEVCAAIKDVFLETRSVLEPSGAMSVAGAKKYLTVNKCTGLTVVAVTWSGTVIAIRFKTR
jgi:threonine dehydratase